MANTIKNSTYGFLVGSADNITFVPSTAVDARLTFRQSVARATEKGSAGSVRIQRNELVLSLPYLAKGSDCADSCATIPVSKTAKLNVSAATETDAQDVIDELIRVLQHADAAKFLSGFKPLPTATFAPVA